MKLDIDFSGLERIVKKMGATALNWTIPAVASVKPPDFGEIDFSKLATTGVPVDLNDVHFDSINRRATTPDGKQILLHIKKVNNFGDNRLPKFHFYECRTLKDMKNKGKFEKYVMTQRKDGYFLMDVNTGSGYIEREEKLDVCKNCLNWYKSEYGKKYSVETFDIPAFFEHFGDSRFTEMPKHTDIFAPKSGYTDDWNDISKQRKEQFGYICQQCSIDLSNYKKFLQTHHVNGVENDNRHNNLKVLCIECHSKQFDHNHMKNSHADQILEIQKIRQSAW